jgi:hypothetical protein
MRQPAALAVSQSPLVVTLEHVRQHYPDIDLVNTPDDQLLFCWTDLARFVVSQPVDATPAFATNTPLEDTYQKYHRIITDMDRNIVGETAPCMPVSEDEASESGECEFILLASNSPPESERKKLVIQIKRRGGIAYRVNIAEIRADAWEAANAVRMLVALG